MNNIPSNIDKRFLWKYLNKKINRIIKSYHVVSIINILFEEILSDLKDGKILEIRNFGKIYLQQNKPRYYHNVKYKKVMLSSENKILKFILPKKIKRKIYQFIAMDKTLKGDYE